MEVIDESYCEHDCGGEARIRTLLAEDGKRYVETACETCNTLFIEEEDNGKVSD